MGRAMGKGTEGDLEPRCDWNVGGMRRHEYSVGVRDVEKKRGGEDDH
jgi:hypothetical protein